VDSLIGQGTTFKVYLPSHESEEEKTGPRPPAEVPATLPGLGKSVLLVEDEPGVLSLATLVLRSAGYRVVPCENAKIAQLAFAREEGRFDLLFSDVVLPGQNGIELATELRAMRANLPVLLCSGYADDRVRWALIEQQGFHFLPKPYPTATLLQAVSDALNLPQPPRA
jgi:CheY-like chemotaxis protein